MDAIKPLFLVVLVGLVLFSCSSRNDWHTASRESAGIAPLPSETRDAVLQVYGADAWGWRGWFAIHTWIAAKRSDSVHGHIVTRSEWPHPLWGWTRPPDPDFPSQYTEFILKGRFDTTKAEKKTRDAFNKQYGLDQ